MPVQHKPFDAVVKQYVRADNLVTKKKATDKICRRLTAAYAEAMNKEKGIDWLPATYRRLVSTTPLKLVFEVNNQKSKILQKDNTVYIKMFQTQIRHAFLIDSLERLNSTTSEVVLTVHREEMEILNWNSISNASNNSQCFILPIDDELIVLLEARRLTKSIKLSNETTKQILDSMYGKKAEDSEEELIPNVVPSYTINFKSNSSIQLMEEQKEAIRKSCTLAPAVFIEAPYGTGKTFVGAHLAVTLAKPTTTPILVVSATNAATARFAETLASMDGGEKLKAVRFVTENYKYFKGSLRDDYPSTSLDIAEVLKQLEGSESLSSEKKNNLLKFNEARDYVRSLTLRQQISPLEKNFAKDPQFKQFRKCAQTAEDLSTSMIKIVLEDYRPNVILITIDYLLILCRINHDFYSYVKNTEMVIVDESSQVLEIAFLVLMSRFCKAHFRFFGDSKQLDPYTETENPQLCLPILQRFQRNNQCVEVMLTTTCRSHPALNELPNKLIYNNKLISGALVSEKSEIVRKIKLPNKKKPTLFINDESGESENNPETLSWSNKSEQEVCGRVVHHLKNKGVKTEEIGVICFYSDQKERIQSSLKDIEVRTVDSFQGREKEVIILLTTRTSGTVSAFLKDKKRINVAITRAKQALFIVGKASYLQKNDLWKTVINHYKYISSFMEKNEFDKFWLSTPSLDDSVKETVQKISNVCNISDQTNFPALPSSQRINGIAEEKKKNIPSYSQIVKVSEHCKTSLPKTLRKKKNSGANSVQTNFPALPSSQRINGIAKEKKENIPSYSQTVKVSEHCETSLPKTLRKKKNSGANSVQTNFPALPSSQRLPLVNTTCINQKVSVKNSSYANTAK